MQPLRNCRSWKCQFSTDPYGGLFGGGELPSSGYGLTNYLNPTAASPGQTNYTGLGGLSVPISIPITSNPTQTANPSNLFNSQTGLFGNNSIQQGSPVNQYQSSQAGLANFGGGGSGGPGSALQGGAAQANNSQLFYTAPNLSGDFTPMQPNAANMPIGLQAPGNMAFTPPAPYIPPAPSSSSTSALDSFASLARGGASGASFLGAGFAPGPMSAGPAQVQNPTADLSGQLSATMGAPANQQPLQGNVSQAQPQQAAPFQGNIPPLNAQAQPNALQQAQANPQSVVAQNPQGAPIWAQLAQNNTGPSAAARLPIQGKASKRQAKADKFALDHKLVPSPPPMTPQLNGSPSSLADDLAQQLTPEQASPDLREGVPRPSKALKAFADSREERERKAIEQIVDPRKEKGAELNEAELHQKELEKMVDSDALDPNVEALISQRALANFEANNPKPERPTSLSGAEPSRGQRTVAAIENYEKGGGLLGAMAGAISGHSVKNPVESYAQKADQQDYLTNLKQWGHDRAAAVKTATDGAKATLPIKVRMAQQRVANLQKDNALADKDYQIAVHQAKLGVFGDMKRDAAKAALELQGKSLEERAQYHKVMERLATWGRQLQGKMADIAQQRAQIANGQLSVSQTREELREDEEPLLEEQIKSKTAENWSFAMQNTTQETAIANLVKKGMSPQQAKMAVEAMLGGQ